MHGAPRSLECAMFGGIKDCEYMVDPKSKQHGSPENEDGFEKFGNLLFS